MRAFALTLVAGVLIGACGGGGADNPTETTAFTGAPVKIYFIGPADLGDVLGAVEAGVAEINSSGGLAGHELQLETCPDATANDETACTLKAAGDGALAFVGSAARFDSATFDEALGRASIANVAPLAFQQAEYAAPVNFPLYTPSLGILTCPQQMADAVGSKRFAGIGIQQELLDTVEGLTIAAGQAYTTGVVVPKTQTDFSAAVEELQASEADTVLNLLPAAMQDRKSVV